MAGAKSKYEQLRPLIIWLGLAELAWIAHWLLASDGNTPAFIGIVVAWMVAMLAWMAFVILAGRRGLFLKYSGVFSNLNGVAAVVTFAVAVFGLIPAVRGSVLTAAYHTSDLQLINFHILRLLAIGTFIKFLQGELPLHFVILGSVPDFLFALSAVVLAILSTSGPLDHSYLIVWHLIGFFIFMGPGIAMFLSVPSPIRIYHNQPDPAVVFRFPMLLAPNFTVPLFMLAHLFALIKLNYA